MCMLSIDGELVHRLTIKEGDLLSFRDLDEDLLNGKPLAVRHKDLARESDYREE